MRPRRGASGLAGVLAVDKPAGMTSHDVVAIVRSATGEMRVGHAGTLDPMATGLLLVLVGPATRLERYLSAHDKRYEACIAFGTATDTLDADGEVVERADVPPTLFDPTVATELLASFVGDSEQMPPAYSAIKSAGVPAYRRARAGQTPSLEPRQIVVHEAVLRSSDPVARTWNVGFHVSKGTYVRALARDIGLAAGTVAHLAALRRTHIGALDVAGALSLDEIREPATGSSLSDRFIDPVPLLDMTSRTVHPHEVADGCPLEVAPSKIAEGTRVALVTDDALLAVYRAEGGLLRAETVLAAGVSR